MARVYFKCYVADADAGIADVLGKGDTGKEYETYEEAADIADKIDLAYKGFIGIMGLYGIPAENFPTFEVCAREAGEPETK